MIIFHILIKLFFNFLLTKLINPIFDPFPVRLYVAVRLIFIAILSSSVQIISRILTKYLALRHLKESQGIPMVGILL